MNTFERHHPRLLMVLLLGTALSGPALAAPPGEASAPAPQNTKQATPAPNPAIEKAMQIARGAKEWHAVCGACHNLRDPRELTDAEWEVAMGQMRVRAHLTGLQERDITAFLKASN